VEAGVRQVLQYVSTEFVLDITGDPCAAELWQRTCLEESQTRQVYADCLLRELTFSLIRHANERAQEVGDSGVLGVLVVDADLTKEAANFLFGATCPDIGSVLSVSRLRNIGSVELRGKVVQRLARHEFGHVLGLVPRERRTNVEDKIGLHCTNLCTMRQGMTLEEFGQLTIEEERAGVVFCRECADYLRTVGLTSSSGFGGIT